jgi:hypothetical protein
MVSLVNFVPESDHKLPTHSTQKTSKESHMNYVKIAKVVVPSLLVLAGVLGYQEAVDGIKEVVCDPKPLSPVVLENPDAGK